MKYPELVITADSLEKVVQDTIDNETLIVTDPHNYPALAQYGMVMKVENRAHHLFFPRTELPVYRRVIGAGGCSALDVGKYFSQEIPFTGIPTILSTSCISVNICILRSKEEGKLSIKTVIPDKTIVPLATIMKTEKSLLHRYSASGFGDLFANISASIHYEIKQKSTSYRHIQENGKEAFLALHYVLDEFKGYDEESISRLARFLHNSSVDVIKRGNGDLSAAFEHEFYELIINRNNYDSRIQTHGFLVVIGTLITTAIYEDLYGETGITDLLLRACMRTGIPCTYGELESISIERDHILDTLRLMMLKPCFITDYIKERGYSLIDTLFAGSSLR